MPDASLSAGQMMGMGISTQRSTFLTWSKESGKPFHRFITWKDLRADNLVKQWNTSITFKVNKPKDRYIDQLFFLIVITRKKN